MPHREADEQTAGTASVVFLGTGTSVGVPARWAATARSARAMIPGTTGRGVRSRSWFPRGRSWSTRPPIFARNCSRERIPLAHCVMYTHEHADHLFGLDDLRLFPFRLGTPVPLYCEPKVESRIRKSYDYAFTDREPTHPGAVPPTGVSSRLTLPKPFEVLGVQVITHSQ